MQQSPIFIKTETFMLWVLQHTKKFPREERFRLAQRIEQVFFTYHESLLYAAKTNETKHYLRKADAELEMIRTYFRFALELSYTTSDQYQYIADQVTEIGRLLGAWLKKA
ncbi:MAG: diversity-generating retroelement protein Avd [Anaerolineae bacterium]|nr:diversity-generating retroelement protein Avd [Anaerolineae bacterium]